MGTLYEHARPRYMEQLRYAFYRRLSYPVGSHERAECVFEARLLIRQDRRENLPPGSHPTRRKEFNDLISHMMDMGGIRA